MSGRRPCPSPPCARSSAAAATRRPPQMMVASYSLQPGTFACARGPPSAGRAPCSASSRQGCPLAHTQPSADSAGSACTAAASSDPPGLTPRNVTFLFRLPLRCPSARAFRTRACTPRFACQDIEAGDAGRAGTHRACSLCSVIALCGSENKYKQNQHSSVPRTRAFQASLRRGRGGAQRRGRLTNTGGAASQRARFAAARAHESNDSGRLRALITVTVSTRPGNDRRCASRSRPLCPPQPPPLAAACTLLRRRAAHPAMPASLRCTSGYSAFARCRGSEGVRTP